MAVIKAFECIHPAADLFDTIAALPYDVYNRAEAKEAVKGKPLSFLNIDRPETQFEDGHDMYAPEVYQKAHDLLWSQIGQGSYVQEKEKGYWVYELTMNGRAQTGIVACASIDDYLNGVIMKHENTRAEKEEDRIRHVDSCNAQTGPIFLAYRKNEIIEKAVLAAKNEKAVFDFVSEDGIRHRGWLISQPAEVASIEQAFGTIGQIYIADGHHRAASAVKVGLKRRSEHPDYQGTEEFNFFLSVLFPDEELMIMDYNRVVKDLNGLSAEDFLKELEKTCLIEELAESCELKDCHPVQKGQVSMYLADQWYRLTFKDEICSSDPVDGLDVSVLQNEVLHPILGIGDPKVDHRIDFVGGIRGMQELERRVHMDCQVAFAMYPTSIGELFAVADAGRLMPPKSTWFEPKLRSGLFIHAIG